jgi:hypothetical protein
VSSMSSSSIVFHGNSDSSSTSFLVVDCDGDCDCDCDDSTAEGTSRINLTQPEAEDFLLGLLGVLITLNTIAYSACGVVTVWSINCQMSNVNHPGTETL